MDAPGRPLPNQDPNVRSGTKAGIHHLVRVDPYMPETLTTLDGDFTAKQVSDCFGVTVQHKLRLSGRIHNQKNFTALFQD